MTQLISCGVGQCGVQMATSFMNMYMLESENYIDPFARNRLFYQNSMGRYEARSVLIDTEEKAIQEILKLEDSDSHWYYDRRSVWAKGCGSGNNWAYGYLENGIRATKEVLNRLQHQAEKCDRFGGFLLFQSLGGGTGSGLGSRITESIRDTFGPRAQIVNQVIWPYSSADVNVQNYNTVLSLSTLLKNSDAVMVTYNDVLKQICAEQKRDVTFHEMNNIFSRTIAGVLLPSNEICQVPVWSQPLAHLVQMPTRRLLSCFCFPIESDRAHGYTNYQWSSIVDNVVYMTAAGNFVGRNVKEPKEIKKCDSLWIILRGEDPREARNYVPKNKLISSGKLFTSDNYDPLMVSTSTRRFFRYDRYGITVANSQVVCQPLDTLLDKFHLQFESSAYLHTYINAGLEKEKIKEDKLFLEQVYNDYKTM